MTNVHLSIMRLRVLPDRATVFGFRSSGRCRRRRYAHWICLATWIVLEVNCFREQYSAAGASARYRRMQCFSFVLILSLLVCISARRLTIVTPAAGQGDPYQPRWPVVLVGSLILPEQYCISMEAGVALFLRDAINILEVCAALLVSDVVGCMVDRRQLCRGHLRGCTSSSGCRASV